MNLEDWARNEVKIACKRENPDWDEKSFDYGCCCYQSALKAYMTLTQDGHSGMSWDITFSILTRLAKGLPLTAITDEDFVQDPSMPEDSQNYLLKRYLKSNIQCPRMSSLFRKEYLDGRIEYNDVGRTVLNDCYGNSLADDIVDELFPITMPYYPPVNKFKVYSIDYRSFCASDYDDYDIMYFTHLITPEGKTIKLDRIYKEKAGWISKEEFEAIQKKAVE